VDEPVVGLVGRITVKVSDMPGEIMLAVRGGYTGFTAYGSGGEVLERDQHAVVIEQTGPNTVMVTATGA
jgi:hypothetical protein